MPFLFFSCQNKKTSSQHKHIESETDQKAQWTCPMHPQIIKDQPGSCPICGMNLVPREKVDVKKEDMSRLEVTPSGHAPFKLSLEKQQMIGVKLGRVEKKNIFKDIDVAGKVAFDPELYAAQSEYLEAVELAEKIKSSSLPEVKESAERGIASARLRLKVLGVSDSYIDQLRKSKSSGSHLISPKSGENFYIYAEIFEMDLAHVSQGQEALLTGGVLGNETLIGKVISVDQVLNPMTRTAKARILISQNILQLRPESFVNVKIRVPLGEHVSVPFDSVLDTGNQSWVFVGKEDGSFEPRLISILYRAGNDVAVGSGVTPGEKIVTSANFLIDSESRLRGISGSAPSAHEHGAKNEEKQTPKKPECPKGQEWHEHMKHCMPKVGS